MSSFFRRLGAELMRLIERSADPAAEAARCLVYTKEVAGVTQLFVRASDGSIYQMTPFAGGAGASMLYGDGSDGNVTIAAGTTTLARDMNYDTLTIQNAGILNPKNFRVFARTAIIMQGTGKISSRGGNGADGLQTTGGTAGTAVSTGSMQGSAAGGAGTAGVGGNGGGSPTAAPENNQPGGAGGAGGSGGGGNGGLTIPRTPGVGGLALAIWSIQQFCGGVSGLSGASGGGGGGGASNGGGQGAIGGGGGGGGGYVVVCAPTISSTGTIESNGGNGGACNTPTAGLGGGGGGGVGGDINVVVGDGYFPTLNANGGNGGAGKNGGGNGANGGNGTIRRFAGVP